MVDIKKSQKKIFDITKSLWFFLYHKIKNRISDVKNRFFGITKSRIYFDTTKSIFWYHNVDFFDITT